MPIHVDGLGTQPELETVSLGQWYYHHYRNLGGTQNTLIYLIFSATCSSKSRTVAKDMQKHTRFYSNFPVLEVVLL